MIKVKFELWMEEGRKARKISEETREFTDIYEAYKAAHMQVFHLPSMFELAISQPGREKRELAVFFGMEGKVEWI